MELEIIGKILLTLLPAVFTGVFSFLITKYTQNRNMPLGKIEIAYNRIYYPMYKLLRNKKISDMNQITIQEKMNVILLKYDKYLKCFSRNPVSFS